MIRSITSSTFAAIMSLPPSTELPGPKNSRSGPKSAVWVGNKFLLSMAGDANSVTPMEQVDGAPLATYTGWNLRHPQIGAPERLMSLIGSTIPFLATEGQRAEIGDPRRWIAA